MMRNNVLEKHRPVLNEVLFVLVKFKLKQKLSEIVQNLTQESQSNVLCHISFCIHA